MKQIVKKGQTSYLVLIFIQDSSSTTGAGLTGLTSGSAGLTCYRARGDDGNANATQIVLSGGTRGTWSSGGFVEKDATNMPGWYEFGVPDAALATGSNYCGIMFKGATNMAPLPLEFQLVGFDPLDAVHLGLSALPNAAAGAANGLLISGVNSGTTTFGAITCTGTFTISDGVVITRSTAASIGLSITGNTSGVGLSITGGNTAGGATITSGGGNTNGLDILGAGIGNGLRARSGTGAIGHGISASSLATNGSGIALIGAGTGHGMSLAAGATGNGINVTTTAGDGILVSPTGGHALNLVANGTSKHGLLATGGGVGTCDGIKGLAGTGGVDIRGQLSDLSVTTYAEPGQETPAATNTLAVKIGYNFKAWRNLSTQTATAYKLYNDDAVTVDQKSAVSDDGTTFSRGEVATGP